MFVSYDICGVIIKYLDLKDIIKLTLTNIYLNNLKNKRSFLKHLIQTLKYDDADDHKNKTIDELTKIYNLNINWLFRGFKSSTILDPDLKHCYKNLHICNDYLVCSLNNTVHIYDLKTMMLYKTMLFTEIISITYDSTNMSFIVWDCYSEESISVDESIEYDKFVHYDFLTNSSVSIKLFNGLDNIIALINGKLIFQYQRFVYMCDTKYDGEIKKVLPEQFFMDAELSATEKYFIVVKAFNKHLFSGRCNILTYDIPNFQKIKEYENIGFDGWHTAQKHPTKLFTTFKNIVMYIDLTNGHTEFLNCRIQGRQYSPPINDRRILYPKGNSINIYDMKCNTILKIPGKFDNVIFLYQLLTHNEKYLILRDKELGLRYYNFIN